MRKHAIVIALAAMLAACAATPGANEPPASPSSAARGPVLTAIDATYGTLSLRTDAGATCSAELRIKRGEFGEAPPSSLPSRETGTDGVVTWTYPAPRVPSGTGAYLATCRSPRADAALEGPIPIPPRPLTPTGLTVKITTDPAPQPSCTPEPSLTALRDASARRIHETLADEWSAATRKLGSLQVVDMSADITVFVVAARGTTYHRQSQADGSQDVVLCVSGELGPRNVENNVAVVLHELGHIWCCNGPGTDGKGHWATKEVSPGLYGVDKYGLMTDPVTCVTFGTVVSCPNRFSDREMRALGFAEFPPPSPDPCITQSLALRSDLASLRARGDALKSDIASAQATLASLASEIRAIEAQYPNGGAPPSVVTRYRALLDQYNTLTVQTNEKIDAYNALVDQQGGLVSRINALPCDPT